MTEAAPPDVKRRRLSAADGDSQGTTRYLTDLPSGVLSHAASFLAAPSRALFAVALDENSVVLPDERSSAIVGNNWDILDFGEIEKDVAVRLSDADIESVLQCLDAVNNVKRLKLTNCAAITGAGLAPLRGSLIIEQIDLSLFGEHTSPDLYLEPPISCDNVLPILDSIIGREGCALKYLQFPFVWRKEPSADSDFHAFIGRYNHMRGGREEIACLECNRVLPCDIGEWIKTYTESHHYGTHYHTCYGCLKHYCYDCNIDDDPEEYILNECAICRRDYCKDCSKMTHCPGCSKDICNYCYKYECVKCNEDFCSECAQKGKYVRKCEYCDKCYCRECNEDDENDESVGIFHCSRCDVKFKCCHDCGRQRYRHGQLHCTKCIYRGVVKDESLGRTQLQNENKQLKVEMEELKRENRELKLENKELKLENEKLRAGSIE